MGDEADSMWDGDMIEAGREDTERAMPMPDKPAKVACPHCGKRLRGNDGVYTHIKAKHGGKGKGAFARPHEDSLADLYVSGKLLMEGDRRG